MTVPNPDDQWALDAAELKLIRESLESTLSEGQYDLDYLAEGGQDARQALGQREQLVALRSKISLMALLTGQS